MVKFLVLFLVLFGDLWALEKGLLENREGQLIIYVEGSAYERGYQHGVLLKEKIQSNIQKYINQESGTKSEKASEFIKQLPTLMSYIPKDFLEEMRGLAEGAEVSFQKIVLLNLFPEMFHCSGLTVTNEATKTGALYHVRVLDYAIGKDLQESSVLMIVKPDGHIPYLNVSYAGFIGSITGMNEHKIAIGEIGGQGYGYWNGIPMSFLMRMILENASSLEEAKNILNRYPRTCEYYYVISDGKTNESFGAYATESQLHFIHPGSSYALMAPQHLPKNYGEGGLNDKFFLSPFIVKTSAFQTAFFQEDQKLIALFHTQPKDCLALIGFSCPERYPILMQRIIENYGLLDEQRLQKVILSPCSKDSNLHNAIFLPSELKVWVAHAGKNGERACDQPYKLYDLHQLLKQFNDK